MNCTKDQHRFEYGQNHEFNQGFQMPYGSKGKHTCVCGEKWLEEPPLNRYIVKGSMCDSLTKDYIKDLTSREL